MMISRWTMLMALAFTCAVSSNCGRNPFNPTLPDEAVIVIDNSSVQDTVTAVFLGACTASEMANVLGDGGRILPSAEGSFEVARGCQRAMLLERTDTIAQRPRIELGRGDTAIIVLRDRT